jgi:transcriptional regulator with XRE-family HTH domain
MPEDADVWQALLRAKGLTVAQLAEDLRTTRQHAHRLLTGKRSADPRRDELDRALALGPRRLDGRPLYALAMLGADGDLELLPAGDTQPLFSDRRLATMVADSLDQNSNGGVCVVPVWPEYAWRRTVAFHAAWGSTAEPRNVFRVDDETLEVPVESVMDELHGGYVETLKLRAIADDPARLEEIENLVEPVDVTTTDRIRAWIDDELHDSTGT